MLLATGSLFLGFALSTRAQTSLSDFPLCTVGSSPLSSCKLSDTVLTRSQQICQEDLQIVLTDPTSPQQLCSPFFRAATASCQAVTCTPAERQSKFISCRDLGQTLRAMRANKMSPETDTLSQEFCGPLYANNATLGSAVTSAIASATPIAIAATAGKDPTDTSNYPLCAVSRPWF